MPIVHMTSSPTLHNFGAFSMPASRGHISPVRRRLFDDVDDVDNRRLERQLAAIQHEQKMRWNFDFARETPLDGRFQWRRGSATIKRPIDEEEAPPLAPPASKLPRADVTIWTLNNNANNRNNNLNLNNNNNSRFTQQTKITGASFEFDSIPLHLDMSSHPSISQQLRLLYSDFCVIFASFLCHFCVIFASFLRHFCVIFASLRRVAVDSL